MNELLDGISKLPEWKQWLFVITVVFGTRELLGFFFKTQAITNKLKDIERILERISKK